jgi:ATP-dependent DNA helicase RecG
MTIERIKNILSQGEGIRNEFKQSREKLSENLFETICAMLNRSGGDIILGADDNGNLTGLDAVLVSGMIANIANLSNNPQKLNPPFILFPKEHVVDGFHVIHLQVPESSQVHQTGGKIYDRSSDGDYVVREAHQIAKLYDRKRNHYTEGTIYPAFRFEDFKRPLFQKVRNLIRSYNPEHSWLEIDEEQMLRMAGLYDRDYKTGEEGYTLAAILLLGKDEAIRSVVPHYKIDALVRKFDTDRYDDRLYIQTNLIEAYEQLLEFVAKHLPDKFYLEGDQRRSLRTIIFREVAANILVHKEYTNAYPTTFVITKSAVIAENANVPNGEGPINVNNFKSYPKNPVIAKFFMQLGRFDELGSGILNINKYCKAYSGHDHPEFIEGAIFKTTIPLDEDLVDGVDAANDTLNGVDGVNVTINDRIKNIATYTITNDSDTSDIITDTLSDRINQVRRLNDRINNVLKNRLTDKVGNTVINKLIELTTHIYWNPLLNAEELANKIHVSVPTINRYLKILKTEKITELRGSRKKGGFSTTQTFQLEIDKINRI